LPGPFWEKSYTDCVEVFNGTLPWSQVQQCGWGRDDSDPNYYTFSSNLVVRQLDPIPGFPIGRDTSFNVPLFVLFQKQVAVQSKVSVSSSITLNAVVTAESVNAMTTTAQIEFSTSVPAPYYISSAAINAAPAQFNNAIVIEETTTGSTSCSATGTACQQKFNMTISTGVSCDINGNYGITFTFQCLPGSSGCTSGQTGSITANVVSETFCPKFFANTYEDPPIDTNELTNPNAGGGTSASAVVQVTSQPSPTSSVNYYGLAAGCVAVLLVVVFVIVIVAVKKWEKSKKPATEDVVPDSMDVFSLDMPVSQPKKNTQDLSMEDF